jgi:hypothetical protein
MTAERSPNRTLLFPTPGATSAAQAASIDSTTTSDNTDNPKKRV